MADTAAPSDSARALPHLGSYVRNLPVSLERMFENAIDWEHLPHLHADSFKAISCRDAGDWGWHCDAVLPNDETIELELRLDREHQRWITRTLSGIGEGTEIWTYVFARPEGGIRVVVDFFMPDIPAEAREQMLAYYRQLYAGLYDEDEEMMTGRQSALEAKPSKADEITLGMVSEVKAKLPLRFELGGKHYRLIEDEGELIAHAALCPHMLGPLDGSDVIGGAVRCPWHGYEFDIRTGVERGGRACRLATSPLIDIDDSGQLIATLTRPGD